MDALDFLQLIGHSLGVPVPTAWARPEAGCMSILQDDAADGRRWLLVVDEAHRALRCVWDEIKAIVNQLGRPGGFAAIVVSGDTELARSLAARDLRRLRLEPSALIFTFRRSISTKHANLLDFLGHEIDRADRVLEELASRCPRQSPRAAPPRRIGRRHAASPVRRSARTAALRPICLVAIATQRRSAFQVRVDTDEPDR